MAIRPCTGCHLRFVGPASTCYSTILDGRLKFEAVSKFCAVCWSALETQLLQVDAEIKPDVSFDYTAEQPCFVCHESVKNRSPQSLFATVYAARSERRDFFASLCSGCRAPAEVLLKAPSWAQETS